MLRLQLQETAVVRKSMPGGVRGGARKESPYSIKLKYQMPSTLERALRATGVSRHDA